MNKEQLYLASPSILQNVFVSVEGLRILRNRYGGPFAKIFPECEARAYWPMDQVIDYRNRRLVSYVNHAIKNVPYYRNVASEIGYGEITAASLDDFLSNMPTLSKVEIQDNMAKIIAPDVHKLEIQMMHTSGTTGSGLRFPVTREAICEQWAIWWRYRRWHKIQMRTPQGALGIRSVIPLNQKKPPFWRYNIPGRQVLFSIYHMTKENLPSYIHEIERRNLEWIHGFPSALNLLADAIIEVIQSPLEDIRWISISGENLLHQQAEKIELAFDVKPLQHYGLAEAVANISMCEKRNLHVDEDFSYVEFVPTSVDGTYRIVGTNFTNIATPLLRYDTGDIVTLSGRSCDCGRPGRIIDSIDGRQEDYVILRNGAKIGRLDHIFKDLINIRETQVYQNRPGEVVFRIIKGKNYQGSDERLLLSEARKRLGDDIKIDLQYLTELERSNSGKLRFVISDIPAGKLF